MQSYTSANTSINKNKLPKLFGKLMFWPDQVNLDYGGGKYDNVTEWMWTFFHASNLVYDPFNRSKEHNKMVEDYVIANHVDSVTMSNVLNVIDSQEARIAALLAAKEALKPERPLYITVYEGDRSGIGKTTKDDCYQQNKPLRWYLPEVEAVFGNARIRNGMIIAIK